MQINTKSTFYIYHEPSETTLEKLNWETFYGFCQILSQWTYDDFFYWAQGNEGWAPLADIAPEVLGFSKEISLQTPPPPGQEVTKDMHHELVSPDSDNREHTRYKKVLSLTLDIAGHLVKVESLDISITGIGFSKNIFLNDVVKYIFCYYDTGSQLLEFKARPIYDSLRPEFNAITLVSCNNLHLWKKTVADLI